MLLAAEIEPNYSPEMGTAFSSLDDTLTGSIRDLHDVDHFRVELSSGDTLTLAYAASGIPGSPGFRPTIEILGEDGGVRGRSLSGASFSFTATASGNYFLRLTADSPFGTVTGAYEIATSIVPFEGVSESESNDTPATANPLPGETQIRGLIAGTDDVDYYSFDASAGQAVAVNFAEQPSASPSVTLETPDGQIIEVGIEGLGLTAEIAQSGTYVLGIHSNGGAFSGAYVGQLLIASEPVLDAETGDSFDAATLMSLGPHVVPSAYLTPDDGSATHGLTGSYFNSNLRGSTSTDWRVSEVVAGTRVDAKVHFPQDGWGNRESLQLSGGSDQNWNSFSVQWDGFIHIVEAGTQLYTASDDGSRMWIDIDGDGSFNSSGEEFINNHWGTSGATRLSESSEPLAVGTYRIRIQYEEGGGGNNAYLLWSDSVHSAGTVACGRHQDGVGVLSSLTDVDVYAVDLSATGFYSFTLKSPAGDLAAQNRIVTLYNQHGQPLEYSTVGRIATARYHYRPETTGRYYVTVQATAEEGLGAYNLVAQTLREFPTYRDIPLFYQDYSGYSKPEQVDAFLAFFESQFDIYQIDLTQMDPGPAEHVAWEFTTSDDGCYGRSSGGFGNRQPSGSGTGTCGADWQQLSDLWLGLPYVMGGYGVGLASTRYPLAVTSSGGHDHYFPVGSYNRISRDPRISLPKLQNERNYLDWVLQAGRFTLEDESNDEFESAQRLMPYIQEMMADADPRNDQAVVVGAVSSPTDLDLYKITAAAGESYAFDIEAAEFQFPLDSTLELLDSSGAVIASSQNALDRDTGIASVDPYLVHTFGHSGDYFVRVRSELGTAGNYRLKVTPERAFDDAGPKIIASWPDGGATIDGTRQLVFWVNDQIDPSTLTEDNLIVAGDATGIQPGTAVYDPLTSTITWKADTTLVPDRYTVTLKSGGEGVTDLQGNWLDGETQGVLTWPQVSGDDVAGGDFTTQFLVATQDDAPAVVTQAAHHRHPHDRDLFEIHFDDELDVLEVYATEFTLRGAGGDDLFDTADDTFAPVDVVYDRIGSTSDPLLRVYSRGVLEPDQYRLEADLLDAAGHSLTLEETFNVGVAVPASALFGQVEKVRQGLIGTYFDESLRGVETQEDWRYTQTAAGARVDPILSFVDSDFGDRSRVGITGGTESDWDNFSVQWDGAIEIPAGGARLFTRSDDSSRLWIDINGDGEFDASGPELVSNHWGSPQAARTGPASVRLDQGTYRIRVQYEEGDSANEFQLLWDSNHAMSTRDALSANLQIVDLNIQPNTALTTAPESIAVTFSESLATNSLTPESFRVRYSPDADFFDGNDSYLSEADGTIAWDPLRKIATFEPATEFVNGHYLIELDGSPGGITSRHGRLLDGEYRDTHIAGYASPHGWEFSPSGDGLPGGDYRAAFVVFAPELVVDSVEEGERLAVSLEPKQEPPEPLVFSLEQAPEGSSIDPVTGQFVWTPSEAQGPGQFELTVLATTRDSQQPFATIILQIDVLDAAPWQYHPDPNDVNADGTVSPLDALVVINHLNRFGAGSLAPAPPQDAPPRYIDVDGNGSVTPLDALRVINRLNRIRPSGEASEADGSSSPGSELFALAAGDSTQLPSIARSDAAEPSEDMDRGAFSIAHGTTNTPSVAGAHALTTAPLPSSPHRSSHQEPPAAAVDALLSSHLELEWDLSATLADFTNIHR